MDGLIRERPSHSVLRFEIRLEWEFDCGMGIDQIHQSSAHTTVSPDCFGLRAAAGANAADNWAVAVQIALATPQALPKSSGEKVLLTIDP
jgi:hypothetical protein